MQIASSAWGIEQDYNTQLHCMHQYQLGLQDKNKIYTNQQILQTHRLNIEQLGKPSQNIQSSKILFRDGVVSSPNNRSFVIENQFINLIPRLWNKFTVP